MFNIIPQDQSKCYSFQENFWISEKITASAIDFFTYMGYNIIRFYMRGDNAVSLATSHDTSEKGLLFCI